MPLKDEIRNELNAAWAAGRQKEAPAAAPGPLPPLPPATPSDIDAMLMKCSTDELEQIVDRAGLIPPNEWRYLTAEQRRALRASNMLAGRAVAAQRAAAKTAHDRAARSEQQAVAARLQREEQAAAELEPLLEKKREELWHRGF